MEIILMILLRYKCIKSICFVYEPICIEAPE